MTTRFRSLDGTPLAADIVIPPRASRGLVLVHGGGVNRHEGGFFDRLADGLAHAGLASLRLDLRGHGESGGRQEDLTLAGVGNDVRTAVEELATRMSAERISLLGASFSGGVCASLASRHRNIVDRLVMINPLLDYKKRFVDDKDYWSDDRIDHDVADQLAANRFVAHSPSFRLGTALLNEVFWWDTRNDLARITAPTLVIHGTKDTFIPIDSSRSAMQALTCESELIELDGAQHGLAVHDDVRQLGGDLVELTARAVTVTGLDEQHRYLLQHSLGVQVHDRAKPHHHRRHGRADLGWPTTGPTPAAMPGVVVRTETAIPHPDVDQEEVEASCRSCPC